MERFWKKRFVGIILPNMHDKVFGKPYYCNECGHNHNVVYVNDKTVIREFWENYWLKPIENGCQQAYEEDGRYAVLVSYDDFIAKPKHYVDLAYVKRNKPFNNKVHWRDIKHKGKRWE